jgi:hypothetical protein
MVAAEFGSGQVFLSMMWFFLFFVWIWLLISIFGDIFRSRDLSGWGKAFWTIFVIVLPFLGVFTYLIARGHKMSEHAMEAAQAQDEMFKSYVREALPPTQSEVDELAKLADLRTRGVIDDAEFQRLKSKLVGTAAPPTGNNRIGVS